MKVTAQKGDFEKMPCDVLVLGMFENEENTFTRKADALLKNELGKALKNKEFSGEAGQIKIVSTLGTMAAHKVLFVGLGKKKDYNLEQLRRAASASFKAARETCARRVVTTLHLCDAKEILHERVVALTEGMVLGNYRFSQFKEERKKEKHVDEVIIVDGQKESIQRAEVIAAATMHVRDLVNMPPNIATPTYLADEALKLKMLGVKVTVYGKKELEKMRFNAMLSVAQGSAQEPKFVVMEYGKGKLYSFVGKGITFDSGGLDIKPPKMMEDMKYDMAGAATVMGIMEVVATLKLPVHIVCAFPTCENMPSGTSYRPSDVITAYNGKTIEMMNTDAEGRMILSDALAYIEKEYKPDVMIDLATLTGACIIALGYWATGMLSNDDQLCEELVTAGNETYERVWRLPLWEEYKENMKSDVADVRSIGKGFDAGTIEGAVFLQHFVDKVKWVHLDIAGTAWFNADKYYFSRGGTGAGVRLLVKWLENRV